MSNGVGTMRLAASSGPSAYLLSTAARDVDVSTLVQFDKPGTGGGLYWSLVGRRTGTSDYRAKLRVTGTDTTLYLARTVGGAETVLTSVVVPGLVVAAGDSLRVRLQAVGTGTTTLRAKVWRGSAAEPATWTSSTTDTTAGLQGSGAVGVYAFLSGTATNAPVTLSFDELRAAAP